MLKEKFTYIKFISIQNGTRFVTGDILEKLEKEIKNIKLISILHLIIAIQK